MPRQPRKMSDVLKEMSEVLMSNPHKPPTSEAAHVALFFANVAWNECVGLGHAREGCRNVWEEIEADNPTLWNEFKSNDIDGMIDELVQYKQEHFPDDKRRILTCGIPRWSDPCGMVECRCSGCGFQMGDATVRASADRRTPGGDSVPTRVSEDIPQRGCPASSQSRR